MKAGVAGQVVGAGPAGRAVGAGPAGRAVAGGPAVRAVAGGPQMAAGDGKPTARTRSSRGGGRSRRLDWALLTGVTVVLAVGCRVPGAAAPAADVTRQLTVAVVPGFASAPLQVAITDGSFSREGLEVTVQTYQTVRQAYAALTSGQADIVGGDYADLLYAQAQRGARLRLVADGYDAVPSLVEVLTLPGSPVVSPQDLQGAAVATPPAGLAPFSADAPYNVETLVTEAVLQSDGVSPSSIRWKPMAAGSMIAALRDHAVSAIVATQPYILRAESELGAVEVLDGCSGVAASLPLSGYFATVGAAERDGTTLRRFRAALAAAATTAAQPGIVRSVLQTLPGMSSRQADLVTVGQYPAFLSVGQVQRVADLMYGTGMVRSTVSVRNLVFR